MDDSPLALEALEYALENHPSSAITVIYVVDYVEESYGAKMLVGSEQLRERVEEKTNELFEQAAELAADFEKEVTTVTRFGNPARNILEYAEAEEVDLIVIGSHGRSFLTRVLLGDTATKVVNRAPIPVTVVR